MSSQGRNADQKRERTLVKEPEPIYAKKDKKALVPALNLPTFMYLVTLVI